MLTIHKVQWKGNNIHEVSSFAGTDAIWSQKSEDQPPNLLIKTYGGKVMAGLGDWIVRDGGYLRLVPDSQVTWPMRWCRIDVLPDLVGKKWDDSILEQFQQFSPKEVLVVYGGISRVNSPDDRITVVVGGGDIVQSITLEAYLPVPDTLLIPFSVSARYLPSERPSGSQSEEERRRKIVLDLIGKMRDGIAVKGRECTKIDAERFAALCEIHEILTWS